MRNNTENCGGSLFAANWVYVNYDWPCGDTARLFIDVDGVIYVTGRGAMTDYTKTEDIPWISFRSGIREINIGDGIEKIGNNAFFGFTGVEKVTLGSGLKEIGAGAFAHCSIEQITLGTGINRIGAGAFSYCNKLKVVFYCGTESQWNTLQQHMGMNNSELYEAHKFYHGTAWKTLTLPAETTEIGAEAFVNTDAEIIVIPRGCESIAADAFDSCASLGIIVNLSGAEITAPAKVLVLDRMPPAI